MTLQTDRWCRCCTASLDGQRADAEVCSTRCRVRWHRWQHLSWSDLQAKRLELRRLDFSRTPPEIFQPLQEEFGLVLDCWALPEDALCPRFIRPEANGLLQPWHELASDGGAWCNPPYSRGLLQWVVKARQEHQEHGLVVVMLIPPSMSSSYMRIAVEHAAEIRFFGRRVAFLDPDHGWAMNGNRGDSCLVIFGPPAPSSGARVSYV